MKLKLLILFTSSVILFSCTSTPKNITYFQDLDTYQKSLRGEGYYEYEPVIKNNDQLLITVAASILDQTKVAQFNLPTTTYLAPGESFTAQSPSVQTYTVDKGGNINFPVLGIIHLGGLTKSEALKKMTDLVANYVPDPIINIQILSFKVTVLGEVLTPGQIEVKDERISILDAIGAAGDMTIYGSRENVLLIRDNNGTIEHVRFDLTKSDVFLSPYYYLQQNDIVVIEPNDTRKKDSAHGEAKSFRISTMSIIVSIVSVVASTIFNSILINSRK